MEISLTLFRLIYRSLLHYRRTGVVVLLGTAVAVAALVGSLLVGASVTGSLRDTALARLGTIRYALTAPRDLRAGLAAQLTEHGGGTVTPIYQTFGAVTNAATGVVIPHVNVIGVDDAFWTLYPNAGISLSGRRAAMNAALARDLGIAANDACLVTVGRNSALSSDLLFAQRSREATRRRLRVTVDRVLPDRGPGGFTLAAGSAVPRNLFVDRGWLLMMLDKGDVANVLATAYADAHAPDMLAGALQNTCTPEDRGFTLVPDPAGNRLLLQSTAMVLPQAAVRAGRQAAQECGAKARRASMYLAERIWRFDNGLFEEHDGPAVTCRSESGPPHEIAYVLLSAIETDADTPQPRWRMTLNQWAAQDLGAGAHEQLVLQYLVPSLDGQFNTRMVILSTQATLPVTPADAALIPPIEGVSDATRIDAWEAPFPVNMALVTPRDETYWERYRTTPKAYVDLETIHHLWASGPQGMNADWVTTLVLTPPPQESLAHFAARYRTRLHTAMSVSDAGLAFRPVRAQALQAAKGSTDFASLFLCMSLFLVAAAAGLAGMLMRLLAERRAAEAGLLLATGFPARTVQRVIVGEGLVLSLLGTLLGTPLGILYAGGALHGLTTWWRGAVGEVPLWLHVDAGTLVTGALCGFLVGLLAVAWGARAISRRPVLELLAGWQAMAVVEQITRRPAVVAMATGLLAVLLLVAGIAKLIPAEGAFFGGGTLLLVAGLNAASALLAAWQRRPLPAPTLAALARRNVAVNRGRSLLVLGLLAGAAFLLVTVAANIRDLSRMDPRRRDGGTGGFSLRAVSTLPLLYDLNTPAGRAHLGFAPEDEAAFRGVTIIGLRVSPGDDISCLNLARPGTPRLLGVPPALVARGGFPLHPVAKLNNPWDALRGDGAEVPAVADAESLEWTLHSGPGKTLQMPAGTLRFTGTLAGSLFSSEVLVAEDRFSRLYPGITAPRYFLIDTPPGRERAVAAALRRVLGEDGLEVRDTREVLNSVLGVQNAYLAIFLAIGGLGMVLGTVGLLVILLRNALERRREFALMLATGYRREALAALLLREHAGLLLAGLAGGTAAALLAVLPQVLGTSARVPWALLIGLLAMLVIVGLASCLVAARLATRGEIIAGLREE
jgi:ABC-type lipoprotein release transport system permease subunit